MTPPVKPEPTTPPASPAPTPTPPNPPATPDPVQALMVRIEQGEVRQRELEKQLAESRKAPAPPRDLKAEQAAFFSDPTSKIKEAVDAAVAPINAQISTFRAQQAYAEVKAQLRRDARFAQWMTVLEPHLDQQVTQQGNYSPEFVVTVLQALIGAATVGNLPGVNAPAPEAHKPNGNPGMIDPPHLRSSSPPPAPIPGGTPAPVQLTEQQRAMARRNRMTDAEYAAWLVVPPEDVVGFKFDPKGGK